MGEVLTVYLRLNLYRSIEAHATALVDEGSHSLLRIYTALQFTESPRESTPSAFTLIKAGLLTVDSSSSTQLLPPIDKTTLPSLSSTQQTSPCLLILKQESKEKLHTVM